MQGISAEITQSAEKLLQWAQTHPRSTLEELKERAQQWKTPTVAKHLEATVRKQGAGTISEGTCSYGVRRMFQESRERVVMTFNGLLRLKRA